MTAPQRKFSVPPVVLAAAFLIAAVLMVIGLTIGTPQRTSRTSVAGSPQPTGSAEPADSASSSAKGAAMTNRAKATFAGGCFWCVETAFEGLEGVISVTSGYTGGEKKNPKYEEVSSGGTGHAESVEILYDPAKITYEALLDVFWRNIDPSQKDGQFCDHGNQYRSAIFTHGDAQKRLALESKKRLEDAPHRWKGPIVTEIVPASTFYPAEEYHQDFWKKDPVRYHSYRLGCGRDRRLEELWGKPAQSHTP